VIVRRPVLRCFPRADRAFEADAQRLMEQWVVDLGGRHPDPDAFQAMLRVRYPSAFVRPREALATLPMDEEVWYVHRRDEATPAVGGAESPTPEPAGAAVGRLATDDGPGSAPVYSAARVAAMVGVPVSLLVSWDEHDSLITPARTSGGIVLYSRNQVEQALIAKRGFAAGQSVDQVRELLGGPTAGRLPADAGTGRRLLVLLAERDPYAAEFSEYFLRTEGYEVEVALSAVEAEARAAELEPDLAVVELLISGGAGAELCARLKSRREAKVLAISSLDFEDAALRAGADAFLAKPFEPLTFVSTVKDLLGESAMLRHGTSSSDTQPRQRTEAAR
jgi:CheY-like chemotaxis protein